ncbi:MAG: DM13 domain-containing protein [Chloroflexi bacterium]|nr:DM13 domain-containing protein [Chloroflexota bacterium]
MEIFGAAESFVSSLYPYRWAIGAVSAVVAVGLVAFGIRRGWQRWVWAHRVAVAMVGVPAIAVALPVGNYLLSPLWERSHLEEASPLAAAEQNGQPSPPAGATVVARPDTGAAAQPLLRRTGEFAGADDFHFGRGTALLIETAPGTFVLRVEEFSVRNGPDLYVYLSPSAKGFEEGALNLGKLKATDGAFNYEIPAGTDVSKFRSAIVWCKQFSALFAVAPLESGM